MAELKKWLTSNLPNYSTVIRTVQQAKDFASEQNIHKCFLFTNKKKTPPIFMALTAYYNNKLRFAVVNDDAPEAKELQEWMEIEHFPTIMIVESVKGQAVTESPMRYYDGNMKKIESMIGWLKKYALTDIKMKEEVVIEKKQTDTMNREKKSLFYHGGEVEDLKEKILADQKPGLVLYLQKDDPKN